MRYRVKKHFQLGQLSLEPYQAIVVEPYEYGFVVTIDGQSFKQPVNGVEHLLQMGYIEEI